MCTHFSAGSLCVTKKLNEFSITPSLGTFGDIGRNRSCSPDDLINERKISRSFCFSADDPYLTNEESGFFPDAQVFKLVGRHETTVTVQMVLLHVSATMKITYASVFRKPKSKKTFCGLAERPHISRRSQPETRSSYSYVGNCSGTITGSVRKVSSSLPSILMSLKLQACTSTGPGRLSNG